MPDSKDKKQGQYRELLSTKGSPGRKDYKKRMKAIRPFVDFDFDLRHPLTASQKRKITIYYNEINALTNRPFQVYRPKRKDHLKTAQEFAQHAKHLPRLKVAFIPSDGESHLKVKFSKKGKITIKSDFVITTDLELDPKKLAIDPLGHVNEVIATDPTAKAFTVRAGRYEIPAAQNRAQIGEYVQKLTQRYNSETDDGEKDNHHYENWLHGLNAHHFDNQYSLQTYMAEKSASIKEGKRQRRNLKARDQRKRAALKKAKLKK